MSSNAGRAEGRRNRRGPADPVRELMHRHAALCANAVDPLEIAAGLEAQGLTDRVAGRFRHRDVFGLAEELYARVPGPPVRTPAPAPVPAPAQAPRIALHLLPGGICAIAALLARVWGPAVCVVAVPLTLAALLTILRAGPLRAPGRLAAGGALWTCWLLGFAVYGERTMTALASGHVHAQGLFTPASTAALVAITLAPAPAAWCAHRFAVRARAHLAPSRGLKDFAGAVRPLLAGTLGLFLLAQVALLSAAYAAAGAPVTPTALAGPAALGLLLFTARLLTVHGYAQGAVAATGTACAAEGFALVAAPFHRLVVDPAAVAAAACGCAALVLGAYALGVLARASAHTHTHTHSSHQDLEQ
ncbi:hypothetical protein OG607_15435 [Streptomyces sp. NBC_01537]|uniref:hypothetical protein n=1 Tax=Streptomyces sp. NBC_01537 TaxID=2903896 RepID=UPI00386B17AE